MTSDWLRVKTKVIDKWAIHFEDSGRGGRSGYSSDCVYSFVYITQCVEDSSSRSDIFKIEEGECTKKVNIVGGHMTKPRSGALREDMDLAHQKISLFHSFHFFFSKIELIDCDQ